MTLIPVFSFDRADAVDAAGAAEIVDEHDHVRVCPPREDLAYPADDALVAEVGARNGVEILLRADDELRRAHELLGELPVRDDDPRGAFAVLFVAHSVSYLRYRRVLRSLSIMSMSCLLNRFAASMPYTLSMWLREMLSAITVMFLPG